MRKVHQEETISTMQFAERAKMVKTSAKSNAKRSYEELEKLFDKLSEEVNLLKKGIVKGTPLSENISNEENSKNESAEFAELSERYENLSQSTIKEIESLRLKLEKSEANINKIDYLEVHEEMEELKDNIDNQNKKLIVISEDKEKERAEYDKKINEANSHADGILREVSHAQHELASVHKQIGILQTELATKDEEIFSFNQQLQGIIEKKQWHEKKINEIKQQIENGLGTISELNYEVEKLQKEVEVTKENQKTIEQKIEKIEKETNELLPRLSLLQTKEDHNAKEIENFLQEKERLTKEVSDLEKIKLTAETAASLQISAHDSFANEINQAKLHLESEIKTITDSINELTKSSVREERNQIINKYASEQSASIIEEIDFINKKKDELMIEVHKINSEIENINKIIQPNEIENTTLKDIHKKKLSEVNHTLKTLDDEKLSKSRIIKNLSAIEESLATAVKSAEQRIKDDMQFNIVEFVQNINIIRNQLEKQEMTYQQVLKAAELESKKIKDETSKTRDEKIQCDNEAKKLVNEIARQASREIAEKNTIINNISHKNLEILRLKETISDNESKINKALTQITKLEADVRFKAEVRDVERKNTMRQTIMPKKMQGIPLITNEPKEEKKGALHGVVLKKTGNIFLSQAIKEAEVVAMKAPTSDIYKVQYDFQAIKRALYANIDDFVSERKEGIEEIAENEEEYKASESESDSD